MAPQRPLVIVVPADFVDPENRQGIADRLAWELDQNLQPGSWNGTISPGRGYGLPSFNAPLSATGAAPATHYGMHLWDSSQQLGQLLSQLPGPVSRALITARRAQGKIAPPGGWITQAELDQIAPHIQSGAGYWADVLPGLGLAIIQD